MYKYALPVFVATLFSFSIADAQVLMNVGRGFGGGYPRQPHRTFTADDLPKFKPFLVGSIGYGFPNQDKYQLTDFYQYYKGAIKQSGPLTAALDYRFNRNMSLGLTVMHGKVSTPYYDYNDPTVPAFNGSLENWAFMVNIVRYMPVNSLKISPYLKTSVGINTWTSAYTDEAGNKINPGAARPDDLAYQVALGARFSLVKHAGIFAEAGYGKYILQGGAFFKF